MGKRPGEPDVTTAAWDMESVVTRCVEWARRGIVREFPCQIPLAFVEPLAITSPRELTPVFYGCYDWHSAVHSHWALVCACRLVPAAEWVSEIRSLLSQQFQEAAIAREVEFLAVPHRQGFERPYGLAWLLQLTSELQQSQLPEAQEWRGRLQPLEDLAVQRFESWLPRLTGPIRTGEHNQTALALGLLIDAARRIGHTRLESLCIATALRFHQNDVDLPLTWEPGPHDFLSPAFATADLLQRCLSASDFAAWLEQALPLSTLQAAQLLPVVSRDPSDGKLAHFAGLNFSRAWMARHVAQALPSGTVQHTWWRQTAEDNWQSGLSALDSEEYMVTHWVGSFALMAASGQQS